MDRYIQLPLKQEDINILVAGDLVFFTGIIYTARDASHERMIKQIESNIELPVQIENNIIYYLGPTPARQGMVIGSAGPTTATRMDKYTPALLNLGLKGMIGKGIRNKDVKDSIIKNHAIYFVAIGGAGALLSKSIVKAEVVAYEDLGTEAIHKLTVIDFPVIVAIDSRGNDIYEIAVEEFQR